MRSISSARTSRSVELTRSMRSVTTGSRNVLVMDSGGAMDAIRLQAELGAPPTLIKQHFFPERSMCGRPRGPCRPR